MGSVRVLSPEENIIHAIAGDIDIASGTNLSNYIVVFPGKRPAHFLRKVLTEQYRSSFIPPHIFSIDNFVDFLARSLLGINKPQIDVLDAVSILYDVHLHANPKLGVECYTMLDSFLPVGIKLFQELEEVMIANLPLNRIRDALIGVQYPKYHSLAFYYESFYAQIENRKLITRSLLYRTIIEHISTVDLQQYKKIILAGFYAFTGVEKEIFRNLSQRENVSFLFQQGPGLKTQLEKIGINIDSDLDDQQNGISNIHFYKAPDIHGQAFGLAALFKQKIDSGNRPNSSSVVVVPAAMSLFPTIHFPLSYFKEEEYNIALGYPLVRTPVYGFINSLMDLIAGEVEGKYSAELYVKFVLHPYTKNIHWKNRSDVTRILFHTIEQYLAERGANALLTLEILENDTLLFERIQQALSGLDNVPTIEEMQTHLSEIHDKTIRRFQQFASIGDFGKQVREVLEYIFEHSTAQLHLMFRPYALQFIETLHQASKSLLARNQFESPQGYVLFLQHLFHTQEVAFLGTPLRGLQVLGLLETRNLQFDTLYFLDANDDVIPGGKLENMLLPQYVREHLGMETYRDQERLKEYYFYLAVHSSKDVHLFYTENTKDGKKEKSRFVQKLLWKFQQADKSIQHPDERATTDRYEQSIRYRVNLINPTPQEIKKTPEVIEYLRNHHWFSAKQLDTYLACPLKFYYSTVLRLEEKDDVSDVVDNLDVGVIVHDILKEYFKPLEGSTLQPSNLKCDDIENVVDRYFERRFGKSILGSIYLLQEQVRKQLGEFLDHYQIPCLGQGVELLELEAEYRIVHNGYKFVGRVDRVEKRNSKTYILDYKTRQDDKYVKIRLNKLDQTNRTTWSGAIGSFQLPMYMLLYTSSTKEPINNIVPAYLFLGRNKIDESIEIPLGDDKTSPQQIYEAIEPIIFRTVNEIIDESFSFSPTGNLKEDCPDCPFNTICGTQWVKGRREY